MCDNGCDLTTWYYRAEKRMRDGIYLDSYDIHFYIFMFFLLVVASFLVGGLLGYIVGDAKAYKHIFTRKMEIENTMTDEEFLQQQPKMTDREILERNAEYLGIYLFNILNVKPTKWFNDEYAAEFDRHLYESAIKLLYQKHLITETAMTQLLDLEQLKDIPTTESEAEEKVREILFPEEVTND